MKFNSASPCTWFTVKEGLQAPTWLRCILLRLPSPVAACALLGMA